MSRCLPLSFALALLGCAIPDGRFGCSDDSDCPSGFVCRESDDRCWRTGGELDAGIDTAGLDVPGLDAPRADVPPPDTAGLDIPDVPLDAGSLPACPVPLVDEQCVDAISAGLTSCAIRPGGGIRCWGFNGPVGALGDGSATHETCGDGTLRDCGNTPVPVIASLPARALAGGEQVNCARSDTGDLFCWGQNVFDLAGSPLLATNLVGDLRGATYVGARWPVAALVAGSMYLGGTDQEGAGVWGTGAAPTAAPLARAMPSMPSSMPTGITSMDVGWHHLCAVAGGQVYCWGKNAYGESGGAGIFPVYAPTAVTGIVGITRVAVGVGFSCALTAAQTVACWGWNRFGQVGHGLASESERPALATVVLGLNNVVEIEAGFGFACARRTAGDVWCWGSDADGQLGDSLLHTACAGTPCSLAPVQVEGIDDAIDLAAGDDHACVLRASGEVWCWGDNRFGQLGNDTFADSAVPVPVMGL